MLLPRAPTLLTLLIAAMELSANACSDFRLNTTSSSIISARTMDFDKDLSTVVEVHPRGSTFHELPVIDCGDCPDVQWTSKYGFVAFNMWGGSVTVEGMNEKGLSSGQLILMGTEYPVPAKPHAKGGNKPILPSFMSSYLLGNFATVAEVRAGLDHFQLAEYDNEVTASLLGKQSNVGRIPMHITVRDATGANLVIEFIKGKVVLYDNVNQVMTNEPPLDEQVKALEANGFDNIPGGYGPTERFIRLSVLNRAVPSGYGTSPESASYLSATQEQRDVADTLHLLDTVRHPPSSSLKGEPSVAMATQWSVVRDHGRKKIYITSTTNQVLRLVDFNKIDFASPASRRAIPVTIGNWFVDATSALLDETNVARTTDTPSRTQIQALVTSGQGLTGSPPVAGSIQALSVQLSPSAEGKPTGPSFLVGCLVGGLVASFVIVGAQQLTKRTRQSGYENIEKTGK